MPLQMIPFLCCRVVKLTIENGICNHSILGFLQLSGLCAGDKMNDTNSATQIANAAIEVSYRRLFLYKWNIATIHFIHLFDFPGF